MNARRRAMLPPGADAIDLDQAICRVSCARGATAVRAHPALDSSCRY